MITPRTLLDAHGPSNDAHKIFSRLSKPTPWLTKNPIFLSLKVPYEGNWLLKEYQNVKIIVFHHLRQ